MKLGWVYFVALVAVFWIACEMANGATFTVNYAEPAFAEGEENDLAGCGFRIRRVGSSNVLVESALVDAIRSTQVRTVAFEGSLGPVVPDDQFELRGFCRDTAGHDSAESASLAVTVPQPPNPPPAPPTMQGCQFTLTLQNGTQVVIPCVVQQ